MLAQIWKKLLLAICIIAILFNVTSKLVNRISLEKAISSSPEGVNLVEMLNITSEQKGSNSSYNTVDNTTNSVSYYTTENTDNVKNYKEYNEEVKRPKSTSDKIIDTISNTINDSSGYEYLFN